MRILPIVPLWVTVMLACSPASLSTGDGNGTDEAAIDKACGDLAYERCKHLQMCSGTTFEMRYPDIKACRATYQTTCVNAVHAPDSAATPESEEACAAAMQGWECDAFLFNVDVPPACEVHPGPRADESSCSIAPQCHSSYCSRPPGSRCGKCAPPPQAGDPCTVDGCGVGLYCKGDPPTCATYAGLGAQCSSLRHCLDGLSCDTSQGSGKCVPAAQGPGAPCAVGGAGCDVTQGLACDGSTGMCAYAALASAGQACGTVDDKPVLCSAGTCPRGVCVSYPLLGETCTVGSDVPCVGISRCIATADGGTVGRCEALGSPLCH